MFSSDTTRGRIEGVGPNDEPIDPIAMTRALEHVRRGLGLRAAEPVTIGHYVLLRRLGAGGGGVVYAAYDTELDRKVAIKVLRAQSGCDATSMASRLIREARALARLTHPNIVAVHGVEADEIDDPSCVLGGPDRGIYVVMELVDGTDARAWLRVNPRPWREVLAVFLDAARGLAFAHAHGIVHRDFKPSNVMLGDDGRVRVLDFGIARMLDDVGASEQDVDPTCRPLAPAEATRTGTVLGTPAYMAPEQHASGTVDPRTDIYAFCATLYEALTGVRPFPGSDLGELLALKLARRVAVPERIHRVPAAVMRVVMSGLHPEPRCRPGSIEQVIARLEHTLARARNLGTAAGAAASLAIAVIVTRALSDDVDDRCDRADREFAETWNDEARSAIGNAFAASRLVHAEETWAHVEPALASWGDRWSRARVDACRVAAGATADAATADAATIVGDRLSCLERARAHFGGVVRLFQSQGADAEVVVNAASVVAALSAPEDCNRSESGGVAAARMDLVGFADAWAAADAGKLDEAKTIAERLHTEAEAENDHADMARAGIVLSRAARGHDDVVGSEELLWTALYDAERATDDGLVSEILVDLVLVATERGRYEEAERFAAHAEARMDRGGVAATLPTRLRYYLGRTRIQQGRFTEAESELREVLAVLERSEQPHGLLHAEVWNVLGVSLGHQGRFAEARTAYLTALSLQSRLLGPNHPRNGVYLGNAAIILTRLGWLASAEGELTRAIELLEQDGVSSRTRLANVLSNLGIVYAQTARADEALTAQTRALELMTEALGPDHPRVAEVSTARAQTLVGIGRGADALVDARRAVSILEHHPDHQARPMALAKLMGALRLVGSFEEAAKIGERAASEFEAQHGEREELGWFLADLAVVYQDMDRPGLAKARGARALALSADPKVRANVRETLDAVAPDDARRQPEPK